MSEHRRTNYPYSTRRSDHQPLVAREKFSAEVNATSTNNPIGSQGCFQSRYRPSATYFPSNCSTVAGTLFSIPVARARERCSSSRSYSEDSQQRRQCYREGYVTNNTCQCYSLERSQYGQSSRDQQKQRVANLETAQSKTTPYQNVQTQPRQTIHRETSRYYRTVSQSARQSNRVLCGRKKPNSSTRTDSTIIAPAPWNSCTSNSRLRTSWDNDIICSFEYARWHCNWRLHAASQTSGVHQILTTHRCKGPSRCGAASYRRQLRNTQTSQSFVVAQTAPPFSPAFHSNVQFMAQHGRTLVR